MGLGGPLDRPPPNCFFAKFSNSNPKLNLYFQDRPRVGKVAVVPGQIYPGRGHRGHHCLQQLAQIRYILSINDVTNFFATFLTPFLPTPISLLWKFTKQTYIFAFLLVWSKKLIKIVTLNGPSSPNQTKSQIFDCELCSPSPKKVFVVSKPLVKNVANLYLFGKYRIKLDRFE